MRIAPALFFAPRVSRKSPSRPIRRRRVPHIPRPYIPPGRQSGTPRLGLNRFSKACGSQAPMQVEWDRAFARPSAAATFQREQQLQQVRSCRKCNPRLFTVPIQPFVPSNKISICAASVLSAFAFCFALGINVAPLEKPEGSAGCLCPGRLRDHQVLVLGSHCLKRRFLQICRQPSRCTGHDRSPGRIPPRTKRRIPRTHGTSGAKSTTDELGRYRVGGADRPA